MPLVVLIIAALLSAHAKGDDLNRIDGIDSAAVQSLRREMAAA